MVPAHFLYTYPTLGALTRALCSLLQSGGEVRDANTLLDPMESPSTTMRNPDDEKESTGEEEEQQQNLGPTQRRSDWVGNKGPLMKPGQLRRLGAHEISPQASLDRDVVFQGPGVTVRAMAA